MPSNKNTLTKFCNIVFTLFITISFLNAQQEINAKLIDSTTKLPIPYATISLNNKSGVISNDVGEFQLLLTQKTTNLDSLFISSMGYQERVIAVKSFNDSIIILSPKVFELSEVLLSNKTYTIDEVLDSIKLNLANNYKNDFLKSNLFFRTSNNTTILKSDFKIKKSSIPEFNQGFADSLLTSIPKTNDHHTEILGDFYASKTKDSIKLNIIKACKLYDKNNEISFEFYENKINTILKKHVKRDSYFKIKSGVFSTKESIDSTFFENEKQKDEVIELIEEKKKNEAARKYHFLRWRKNAINNLKHLNFIGEKSDLNFIHKSNRYNFEILDFIYLNDNFVYKISFKPKRKEDYKGFIYVNIDDYAIIRVDYENVKNLKSFGLLGISYKHNLEKGTIIYEKTNLNYYVLKYSENISGNKFSVKRPLKIIEKNKHVKGKRKQNELSGKIHFIINSIDKKELVVFNNESITKNGFKSFTEAAKVIPTYLKAYDPEFWKGYAIIAPNEAIKSFKILE